MPRTSFPETPAAASTPRIAVLRRVPPVLRPLFRPQRPLHAHVFMRRGKGVPQPCRSRRQGERAFHRFRRRCRASTNSTREGSPAMQAEQHLHQAMRNQFVQRQQFVVRLVDRTTVLSCLDPGPGLQRFGRLRDHRVLHDLAGHLPQGDEAIDRGRESSPRRRPSCWWCAAACSRD